MEIFFLMLKKNDENEGLCKFLAYPYSSSAMIPYKVAEGRESREMTVLLSKIDPRTGGRIHLLGSGVKKAAHTWNLCILVRVPEVWSLDYLFFTPNFLFYPFVLKMAFKGGYLNKKSPLNLGLHFR